MLASWALMTDPSPRPVPNKRADVSDVGDLIEDIVTRFHEVHRRDFPDAIRLARRLERLYEGEAQAPPRVADQLATMFDELEAHQQREERVLFPAMLTGGCAAIQVPVRRMMAEHDDVDVQLATLEDRLGGYVAPPDAPPTWIELVALCRKIDRDLREHMRIENEDLFAPYLR